MAKKQAASETKTSKTERLSRDQAAAQAVMALKGTSTLSELAVEADKLFVAGGGESKVKNQKIAVIRSLIAMEAAGIVKLTKPTDIIVEKL